MNRSADVTGCNTKTCLKAIQHVKWWTHLPLAAKCLQTRVQNTSGMLLGAEDRCS